MCTDEIIMGYKEDSFRDGSIKISEAISWLDMILVSSIQSFNHLFVGSIFFRFGVEVLQTNDVAKPNIYRVVLSIYEMKSSLVGWIAISN